MKAVLKTSVNQVQETLRDPLVRLVIAFYGPRRVYVLTRHEGSAERITKEFPAWKRTTGTREVFKTGISTDEVIAMLVPWFPEIEQWPQR